MTEMMSIKASAVGVKIGRTSILSDLEFNVRPGSLTGLIGPSGSGKTTLMRAIAGVQKINKGSLTILDHPAGVKMLRRKIGYMAQSPAIYGDLTVRQNVAYFAKVLGVDKHQAVSRIAAVDLTDHQDRLVDTLSGGQKTRVSLAIALLGNPDILILDEPTVGLDPVLRRDLWRLFKKLTAQGKTLIISSHVMDEAERCDNLLLLRDGRLLWSDSRVALLASQQTTSVEVAFLQMIDRQGEQ